MKKTFFIGNGNDYLYLTFLAQNGVGTAAERSKNFWERPGNGDEQKGNGTVTVTCANNGICMDSVFKCICHADFYGTFCDKSNFIKYTDNIIAIHKI